MAPGAEVGDIPVTGILYENEDDGFMEEISEVIAQKKLRIENIRWDSVVFYSLFHFLAIYALILLPYMKIWTIIYGFLLYEAGSVGTMAGSHRLWSHKAYKAKWPLRLILIIFTTIAYQKSSFEWARNHRVHHKYSDTDADPHNSKRGFLFSHIGWQFLKKEPEVIEKGKKIDVSDLLADPFVRFQYEHSWIIPLVCFLLPPLIPMYFWNETFMNANCMNMLRFIICLHASCSINSFAHIFGNRPYNRNIQPTENLFVSIVANGEGWHNYHHTFPWDYRAGEFGRWNLAYHFINFFAKIGWAYDLKTVSEEAIKKRMEKTGEVKEL